MSPTRNSLFSKKLFVAICGGVTLLFVGVSSAEQISLWKEKLPGFRQAWAVDQLPDHVFSLKGPSGDTGADASAKEQAASAKISALPITGLVWSNVPQERRVLLGDIVMREGEAIPSYVFNDNQYYILAEIFQNHLHFKLQDETMSNSFDFDVPFGLKNEVKNQSNYSTSSKNDKK